MRTEGPIVNGKEATLAWYHSNLNPWPLTGVVPASPWATFRERLLMRKPSLRSVGPPKVYGEMGHLGWGGGGCPAYLTGPSADPPAYTQSFTGRDYRWPLLLLMVPAYEEKHLELWSNGLGG